VKNRPKKRPKKRTASTKSAERAAKARTNGKRGGRPRGRLPAAVLDEIGPPPADALALARWAMLLLARTTWLRLRGEIGAELEASVRSLCKAINTTMPLSVAAELDRLLRDDAAAVAADEVGPQPEPIVRGKGG
jgi:hypothetical protein